MEHLCDDLLSFSDHSCLPGRLLYQHFIPLWHIGFTLSSVNREMACRLEEQQWAKQQQSTKYPNGQIV